MASLFLLKNPNQYKYDTYREAVIVADTYEEAVKIHPNGNSIWDGESWGDSYILYEWCKPEQIIVKCVGKACGSLKVNSVLTSSFNNG